MLYTVKDEERVLNQLHGNIENARRERNGYGLVDAMKRHDDADVRDCMKEMYKAVLKAVPTEVRPTESSLYTSMSGNADEIEIVYMSITSRIKSAQKFKMKYAIPLVDTENKVFSALEEAIGTLVEDAMVRNNLIEVNKLYSDTITEIGLGYGIRYVSKLGNEEHKIADISDDEVVLVAETESVLNLEKLILFGAVDKDSKDYDEAYQRFIDELLSAQTPEQFIKIYGGDLGIYLCGFARKQPITYLKETYQKYTGNLNRNGLFAYYKDNVFAVIEQNKGEQTIVLSPFNTKTYRKVSSDELQL